MGGGTRVHIFHKNQPSISVQLTATSAMGILKHWAIYRSSTSKALWQAREQSTAVVQQLHCNGSSALLLLTQPQLCTRWVQNWKYGSELSIFSYVFWILTQNQCIYSAHIRIITFIVLNPMSWPIISNGMQPLQSKQPWLDSVKASVMPDDTSEGLCGCDWLYYYCLCYYC